MARRLALSGFVGGMLAVSSWTAMAQEAPSAPGDCSGFMCKVFGSKLGERPAPQAPVVQATPATDVADPADAVAGAAKSKPARKAAVKPVPIVTIAAGSAEAVRLKALAASLPKTRVHIVGTDAAADFTVAPVVDGAVAGERARLFTEQLHIVAGPGVHALSDLENKVVSFGPANGATQAAARKAFAALGLSVKETPLEIDNALDGIATGDVAAALVLAPQPDPRLARLKTTSGLHLVSWPEGSVAPDGDTMASIPGAAYPGLAKPGDSVRALGVEAALDASGKGATSPAAKAFLAALTQHSAALGKRGFDLIKVDLETRNGRRVASADRR